MMPPEASATWNKWVDGRIDRFVRAHLIDAIGKVIGQQPATGKLLDGVRQEFRAELQRHEQNLAKIRDEQEIDTRKQITKLLNQKNERGEFEARVEHMLLAYETQVLELRRELDELRTSRSKRL